MDSAATSASSPDWLASFATAVADRIDEEHRGDLSRYLYDPVLFARECIDWGPTGGLTPYQEDVLARLVTKRRAAVRGPHGLGKTTTNAVAVIWFAVTRAAARIDWKVITTAGAWRQLEKYLWPEIHKWASRLRWDFLGVRPWRDKVELLDLSLKLAAGEAFAAASDNSALIEGAHADAILYIYDESKAIRAETFDASEGAFSGARPEGLPEAFGLAQSTPGAPLGRFYDIHSRKPGFEDWDVRHVTVDEAIAAGRISQSWVDARRRQWGPDSALFANRVLGEFHADDEDGVIPLAWVEAAVDRWRAWRDAGSPEPHGRRIVGIDVARSGNDRTVFALRHADVVTELRRFPKQAITTTTGAAVAAMTWPGSLAVVDIIGLGAGVHDGLIEQQHTSQGFVASARTDHRDHTGEFGFVNLRSAAWWNLREMLDPAYGATLALPDDDELLGDLTAPRWQVKSNGKIAIESKDDIRARLGRSPDAGDAVMQACWPRSAAGHGEQELAVPYGTVNPDQIDGAARYDWDMDEQAVPYDWQAAI